MAALFGIDVAAVRPIALAEYERMVELGLFEDEHVELLEGWIIRMSPHGPDHDDAVTTLTRTFLQRLGDDAVVRTQCAFATERSQPEPDIAIVPAGSYRAAHPRKAHLIVEVARSSVATDRGAKADIYASAGVPEYWILNLQDRQLEVHRDPAGGRYTRIEMLRGGQSVAPIAFPQLKVSVTELL